MSKPAEEGKIWEWRAFGRISDELAAKVRAYPIRFSEVQGDDIYLISPLNDQNVKLRQSSGACVLKLKLLCDDRERPFELYREAAELTYPFPVELSSLQATADLLEVTLPENSKRLDKLTVSQFIGLLGESDPAVVETTTSKKRSQYQFDRGWLELAEIRFAKIETQSISIHSRELQVVKDMVSALEPYENLEAMNYIEACRRWS